jgi:asparagine synthase (glutamine-hydrolysing)
MCGIAGIWGDASMDRLQAMADALRHRGPDEEGYWTQPEDHIGFAHRRLSIIDLAGGRQPIANEDGRVVTISNGEIYNYKELREELITAGHVFKTETDTEVIVHLYEDHGVDFVEKIRGMFAIAIWDDAHKQLVLLRDRLGKKPLYFGEANGEFLFASEIKGLVACWRGSLEVDDQALVDYLGWGMVHAPATIYRQLRSAEPGELIVVRDRRVSSRSIYWRQRMLPKSDVSAREAVEQIDDLLRESVRLRLRSDVPVGSFLSGGIDSGIVTAIAAQEHPGRLTTITIGFEDGSFDERPLAKLVADRYDTDHHEVLVKPQVAEDLPRIAQAYDQPFGGASAIPSYYVAKAARQFVKVVLNGDGGDEILAGYRRYVAGRINGLLLWADTPRCRKIWRGLSQGLPVPRRFRSGYAFAHRLLRGLGMDPATRYVAWAVDGIDEPDLRRLCGPVRGADPQCWADRTDPTNRLAKRALDGLLDCGPVDRMMGADVAVILPHDLLVKMDIATMACGLEARSPLLDHKLIEVVSRYPEAVKLQGFSTKPLLRAVSRRYLPTGVQKAPKRGFEVPLVRWLRGELRELCEDVVLSRNGLLAERFDRTALERLVREKEGLDPARWSRRVWHLLMLGMWDAHANKASTAR